MTEEELAEGADPLAVISQTSGHQSAPTAEPLGAKNLDVRYFVRRGGRYLPDRAGRCRPVSQRGVKARRGFREDKPEGSLGKAHVIQKTRFK